MSAVYPKKLPKPPLKVQEKVVPSKVKYKKPKQKSILKEIAQGYTAATTLHGFQYLGESGVHLLERYVQCLTSSPAILPENVQIHFSLEPMCGFDQIQFLMKA